MDCLQEAAAAPRIDPAIGRAVQRIRKAKGILQIEVATPLGVTVWQYSRYERGRALIPDAHLCVIAEALGVDPEEFGLPALVTRTEREREVLKAFRRIQTLEAQDKAFLFVNAIGAMQEHASC